MRRRPLSSTMRGALVSCVALPGVACVDIVSLDPTIGPGEATAVPALIGDWIEVIPGNEQEADTMWVRVTRERDSTRYLVTSIRSGDTDPSRFGRPMAWLRVRPAGDRLLAELTPARTDVVLDSAVSRYGGMLQLAHQLVVLKPLGDSLQYWLFDGDSVRTALTDARCPQPGRVIDRHGTLVFSGDGRELRMTTDCLIAVPGVLGQPETLHRWRAHY